MKKKDIIYLASTALVVGIISFVLAGIIFKNPSSRSSEVPVAQPIKSSFPDLKNDPAYKAFLNEKALDPTQSIQIGNGQNSSPFNVTR